MHLRCPHCQNPIEIADVPSGGEITCAGCGSSFKVAGLSTATWDEPTNKRIGKFEVIGTVGHGAFGTVLKARDTELDRIVAIKVPRAGNIGPNSHDLDRFLREARSVGQLRYPAIITIHEVGMANGAPYLVCDFVEGLTLADHLTGRGFTFRESVKLLVEVADALQYAHSLGIVHRDVKPSNIMIRPDGSPCVMDFGLAKRDAGEITMTIDGQILGTPAYMSPEQARGEGHRVDGRSDVYSLGVILYQLLTGELPFRGNKAMMLHQVLHDEPLRLRAMNDRIPGDLETITLKAMAKEPRKRYDSARDLADELRRWLAGEPILARPVGWHERLWRWCKRKPALAITSGAAAFGVLFALATFAIAFFVVNESLNEAKQQAEKATKAKDFLVSIFRISEKDIRGGNVTARQIVSDAEKRIPVEFANQPELRAELLTAIEEVNRTLGRSIPAAMILEVRGLVQLEAATKKTSVSPQALLFPDDRLTLAADAEVKLVFLSDLHQEQIKPATEIAIGRNGCEPADAVSRRDNSVMMTFARLPKGTFFMGWDGKKKGTKTEIKDDFEIAVHSVTQGQWHTVMGNNPSWFSRKGNGRSFVLDISDEELKLFPVENVSWHDTQVFIRKLNEREKSKGWIYRLPTESEWEYACRGAATTEVECSYHFYFAKPTNDLSSDQANFNAAPKGKYLRRPTRVGAYPSNNLGLCDMHGNVWQWCADTFAPGSSNRVLRGGGWYETETKCRASYRLGGHDPTSVNWLLGFRLARVRAR